MKPFLKVDANRAAYHADPMRNSVHRSSLLVPRMPGTDVEISFLNHFLLKRNYPNVGCRITALDAEGRRIESRLVSVTEPRVYTLPMNEMFGPEPENFLVEFYAAENLFIPFPAVMVNHRGPGYANMVHSFNRVLNDVFEDDEINTAAAPPEASIDADCGEGVEGFFMVATGMVPVRTQMALEYASADASETANLDIDMPRFSSRLIEYRSAFPDIPESGRPGVLKIAQPPQPMFYSRLFAGRRDRDGAFSANHSYYDTSAAAEYWDNELPGYRSYPYFAGLGSRIRMYPIMAPGDLRIEIGLHTADGREAVRAEAGTLTSPGADFLEADVDTLVAEAGLSPDNVASYAVHATPAAGNSPTRVNHQLLYGGRLFSSVNVSLKSENNFKPSNKPGLTWGQVLTGGGSEGYLGIAGDDPAGPAADVEVTIYDESGELGSTVRNMPSGGSVLVDVADVIGRTPEPVAQGTGGTYWFVARSQRPDLTAMCVTRHASRNQTTGEHGF
jgi:hypothetical protein